MRPNEIDYSTSLQDLSYFGNANIPASMTRETIQDEYIPTEIWNHVSAKHCVAVDRLSQRKHLVRNNASFKHLHLVPLDLPHSYWLS